MVAMIVVFWIMFPNIHTS